MRDFQHLVLATAVAFGLLAASPAMAAAPAEAQPTSHPRYEDFIRDSHMSPPQLSPDGKRMAWVEGNTAIVYNLEDGSEKTLPGRGNRLESLEWVGNGYLIVYIKRDKVPGSRTIQLFDYSPLVLDRDANFVRLLFQRGDAKVTEGDLTPVVRYIETPKPSAITIGNAYISVLDIATGKRTDSDRILPGYLHFSDQQGRERAAVEMLDGKVSFGASSVVFHYRLAPGARHETLKLPEKENIYYDNYAFSEVDNAVYWSEIDYKGGQTSIYRQDLATGQKTLFRSGPDRHMTLVQNTAGGIVGIATVTDRNTTEWIDPYYLKLIGAIEKLFPKAEVDIADMTDDRQHIVFLISAPEAPDSYYYYSAATKDLVRIGGNYPQLDNEPLAEMTYVTYKARDGLDIPAYVTKRKDTPANAPLIVMPHGGPASRDTYGFSSWGQFFAARGYVVLQPQYRGSAGFGDTFQRAGNKNLDKMTTDLEDGVRFLQSQNLVDPKKVCVVGWSWGGYLAQAALAFTPDTYACGVSRAGVSDLFESLNDDNDIWWGGYSLEYWRGIIGHEWRDADIIRATSPIEHIKAIKAPLLLIHGELDNTVSHYQSERMNGAMKRAGKDITYLPIKFMHHSPEDEAQRLLILKTIDEFVTKAFDKTIP